MNALTRLLAWLLAFGLLLLPVVAVLQGWLAAGRWPIERLRITAEYQRVDFEQVRRAVAPEAARGFFAVDLAAIRRAVQGLDWVADAEVRKVWPNLLEITIYEHQPYARWGEDRLVSTRGRLFPLPATGVDPGLPRLSGDDRDLPEVLRVHREAAPLFARHGFVLAGVRLSARGSWSFRLGDGARVVAGRGDPLPRLARLMPVLAKLQQSEALPLVRADLRYANGLAVRWGSAALPTVPSSPIPATKPAT